MTTHSQTIAGEPAVNWLARPYIIAGPCSAETPEQLLATCKQVAETGQVHMLRAGIWKPRTKPGGFEGVGAIGLEWLQQARAETGLPITVEVATAKHVEAALAHDVDVLWIGARTTVNPFSVQEIADALAGVQVPVLIKNPVNPDIELWTGAVERVAKAGIEKIGLIHRGFSSTTPGEYRNPPQWRLAVEMRRRMQHLPMICDPSHICGRRDLLLSIARQAANLGFDGLMIESHITPDEAWSDARQQITPAVLNELLQAVHWPNENVVIDDATLEQLRHQIDEIDDEILNKLSRRMQLSRKIGAWKKEHNMAILQTRRWNEILERALAKTGNLQMTREFMLRYFDAIHMESIHNQEEVWRTND